MSLIICEVCVESCDEVFFEISSARLCHLLFVESCDEVCDEELVEISVTLIYESLSPNLLFLLW